MNTTKPIPLTEEWLLKFGYKLFPTGTYLQESSGNPIWFTEDMRCNIIGELFVDTIKYAHQLQNLYHSLTGEELQIK